MTNVPTDTPAPASPTAPKAAPLGRGSLQGLRTKDLQRIAAALDAELPESTRTIFDSGWRSWETWCRRRGQASLPAAPHALAVYLTERAGAGLCNGTIDGDCAAITHRHHQECLGYPTAAAIVRRVRHGLRRIIGTAPRRQAHPLTVVELDQIVASIDTASRIGVRDRAVLLLGYAGALRPSEIAALHLADVAVDSHGCSSRFDAPRPTRMDRANWSVLRPDCTPPPILSAPSALARPPPRRARRALHPGAGQPAGHA